VKVGRLVNAFTVELSTGHAETFSGWIASHGPTQKRHHQSVRFKRHPCQTAGLWERVSKISADGPHRIQHLGMLSAAPETAGAVDWSTTVFKLTYRYDQAAAGSDCLLRRLVGHEDPSGASEEVASPMAPQDSPSLHSSRWHTTS
jgi:hypothetical protein